MKQELREKAEYMADLYGYDSLQAAIRFLLTGFTQGRITPAFSINDDEWVTTAEDKVLREKAEEFYRDERKGKTFTSNNVDELMNHLLKSGK